MVIIKNKEDFEEAYYYDKKYLKEEKYPTHYPCIMEIYTFGGGLMGEQTTHFFVNLPQDPHIADVFIRGYSEGQKALIKQS